MPTKNTIELGAGTLYLKPLDGGEPVQLQSATIEVTPVDEPDILGDCPDVARPLRVADEYTFTVEMDPGEAWEKFQELFIKPVAEAYRQYIRDLAAAYVAWCMENHPDWVHILRRTKKKRTRKKYHDRLRRAFLEEVKHGQD
jgi:hypothetical protein